MPLFSIIISTFDRVNLWKNLKLLDALYNQTETDAECLIIDDNSNKDTINFLQDYIRSNTPPFPFRLVKCLAEKKNSTQASALPDNIAFLLAKGDIIVHLDDDGYVHKDLLKYTKSLNLLDNPACFFGNIIFLDPITREIISLDSRKLGRPIKDIQKLDPNAKTVLLKKEYKAAWGALYCVPTQTIREIGGHVMELSHKRGTDARLGRSLENTVPCYFTIEESVTFWHFGLSWIRQKASEGEKGLREIAEQHKIPFQSYFVKENEIINNPTIVNGGLSFWTSGQLDNLYEIIN